MRFRSPIARPFAAVATAALILTACGGDDPGGELAADVDIEDEDAVFEALGGGSDGELSVVVDGEELAVDRHQCVTIPGGEARRYFAIADGHELGVSFSEDRDHPEGFRFDEAGSVHLEYFDDDHAVVERWTSSRHGGVVTAWGDMQHATGTARLFPDVTIAEYEEDPVPPIEVEFTIVCEDGHPVRDRPAGLEDPEPWEAPEEEDPLGHFPELDAFDSDDGWSSDHADVEVPDEPGTGILVIAGERFEMLGECSGGPVELEPGDEEEQRRTRANRGWFGFEASFVDSTGQTAALLVERSVGTAAGGQRLAQHHKAEWYYGNGIGTIAYKLGADGATVEPRSHQAADGPLVHVDESGVVTVQAEITESLQGEAAPGPLEFGARCQAGWDPAG